MHYVLQLSQGVLVKVYPALIKRSKTHFHNLPCGASIILGKNGFIWISPTSRSVADSSGGFTQNLDQVKIHVFCLVFTFWKFNLNSCDITYLHAAESTKS